MSIRAKILSILMCALTMTFVVSALASYHVSELDAQIGMILERNYPIAHSAHAIQSDITSIRISQEKFLASADPIYRTRLFETLKSLETNIETGRDHWTDNTQANRWSELVLLSQTLREHEDALSDSVRIEVRLIETQQRRLKEQMVRMRSDAQRLARSLSSEAKRIQVSDTSENVDEARAMKLKLRQASDAAQDVGRLLEELERLRYSAREAEAFRPQFQQNVIPRRLALVETKLKTLAGLLATTHHTNQLNKIASRFPELAAELEEVNRQIFDVNARVLALIEDSKKVCGQIDRIAVSIEEDEWALISARRDRLIESKTEAGKLILGFLVLGLLLVGGMAFAVLRSLSQTVGLLLDASRKLRRGDLDAQVPVSGSDELSELGVSFNVMAQYLQARRHRQDNYNEIVTVLNSSLGMDKIVSASLSEVIRRTDSVLGAIYLKDNQKPVLRMRDAFAVSARALHKETIRIGEGVIGQVAKTRRMAVVAPVPAEVFALDVGGRPGPLQCLLVLPMVHLDELLGVVVLGGMRTYSEEDIRFIEEVVFQISVSINNARFYQTIEATAVALRENRDRLVAQRHEMEEVNAQLGQANKQLEEANRIKSEFLANVTHELRTPLNSIIGFTDLVLDTATLKARQEKNLGTVLRNAQNLLQLINDLLDISQMESSKITLIMKYFDLGELIEEVVEMIGPMAGVKNLKLTANISAELPRIHSDRMRLKQVLVNLVNNAVKFTDSGNVVVEAEMVDDRFAIHVRDSGIGMRSEDLRVIFDKFRQLDGSSRRKYGGVGLGLAISQRLCRLLGGDITAASVSGEGSTFTLKLPRKVFLHDDQEQHSGESQLLEAVDHDGKQPVAWRDEGGRPFLLVMDDDPLSVVNLREGVRKEGLEVKSAFTATEAVDILSTFEPVAVVIGAALPEDSGSEVTDRAWALIKENRVPVMLVWDGEGEMPSYGYPIESNDAGVEVTRSKLARVIGRLERPIQAQEVLAVLKAAKLLNQSEPDASSPNNPDSNSEESSVQAG